VRRAFLRFAAAAALLAALPAPAAGDWENFFVPFLGDLRAEAAEAQMAGKAGILLMFHFDDCPYCAKMKREVLSRPEVQRYFRERFASVAIDTRGAQEVTGFDGRTLPEKEFARSLGLRASPTFRFHSFDGKQIAEYRGAIYDPAEFILLGEYVASGAYRSGSFASYKQSKRDRQGS
jgi:thioredoxin-related protein